ncbi:MAG: TonB-dependent receptor [Psychroserpens sp.]|uniref:carboxypeptidase-like regulatory domain-containing protein n=1 Tax=Psychroserpens sp. TaxID=2020870 RepID=UPI003C7F16F6
MKLLFLIVIFILISHTIISQTLVSGRISDEKGMPIPLANVLIQKKDSTRQIISYTYTNNKGIYKLSSDRVGNFNIVISALGFEKKNIPLQILETSQNLIKNTFLLEKPISLNQITIKVDPPIIVRNDTITVKSSAFTNGTEQTVEDLLKKIPGLNISSEGIIRVGNVEIEKLMVDGDDLFEKGYRILSKNMPAYPIDEIEILKHYSNNKLLKNIENSDKIALNLKLSEDYKNLWFGNLQTNIGNDNFYELKSNLMNLGKKNKYFFLTNFNNIGIDATGDINSLIRPYRTNESSNIGDSQLVRNLLNLPTTNLNFDRSRTNFNNAKLLSLNAIFNPNDQLKIKTLAFFNWDKNEFFRNKIETVDVNDSQFTNTEELNIEKNKTIAFGKFDLTYDISKTQTLETTTKFNASSFDDGSNLAFNNQPTVENLNSDNTLFDQKINYTNRLSSNKALLITGHFKNEEAPQNYEINQFFFEDLFTDFDTANNVQQSSDNQMQYIGLNAHLLDKKVNDNLLELQLGNSYRKDKLNTTFSIFENNIVLENPEGFQNRTTHQINDLYLKSKYTYKIKNLGIVGKLDLHQFFNKLSTNSISTKQNPFFINPNLGINWKINENHKISSSYAYNSTNTKTLDVFSDFVLTNFRSFSKGTGDINRLNSSVLSFNYNYEDWEKQFFINTSATYSKNHDFLSTNSVIEQNYIQTEKILIKNRSFLNINTTFDYFINIFSSNLKIDMSYLKSNFKNSINNSELRTVVSTIYNYGFELKSGFTGKFNYHFGTKWTYNEIQTNIRNSFNDNESFLDFKFLFNKKLDLQLQTERYYFGNLSTDKTYYFIDFETRYELVKTKLTLGISGKNLFNTNKFRNFNISDIGTSTTEYQLLPRYVLFKLEYRF